MKMQQSLIDHMLKADANPLRALLVSETDRTEMELLEMFCDMDRHEFSEALTAVMMFYTEVKHCDDFQIQLVGILAASRITMVIDRLTEMAHEQSETE